MPVHAQGHGSVRWVALSIAVYAWLFTGAAWAQPTAQADELATTQDTSSNVDPEAPASAVDGGSAYEARQRFIRGQEAADAGRWADAEKHFREAYALSRVPTALFNRAFALRALGRHIEAREAFASLLESHPQAQPDLRDEASRLHEETSARIAIVELTGLDADTIYLLRVDGTPASDSGQRPLRLEFDAGQHGITLRRRGYLEWHRALALSDGDRVSFHITMNPVPSVKLDGSHWYESAWVWSIAGALVLGGAATAWLLLDDDQGLQPRSDRVIRL